MSNEEAAKDCLQDSLVHILKNIGKYEATGSFTSWAARVTATQCLQCLRKEKKHINPGLDTAPEPFAGEEITTKLHAEDVMKYLDTLSDNYRVAINMFVIEGYSHREVAEYLDISESSSRSLVSRARQMIEDHFAKEELPKQVSESREAILTTVKKITKLA